LYTRVGVSAVFVKKANEDGRLVMNFDDVKLRVGTGAELERVADFKRNRIVYVEELTSSTIA
jgi:hypothetical protein